MQGLKHSPSHNKVKIRNIPDIVLFGILDQVGYYIEKLIADATLLKILICISKSHREQQTFLTFSKKMEKTKKHYKDEDQNQYLICINA